MDARPDRCARGLRAALLAIGLGLACTAHDARPQVDEAPQDSGGFRLVALHEGHLDLLVRGDRPYVMLDGEPIELAADGTPRRDPSMHVGLSPSGYRRVRTLAFAGGPGTGAWLTTADEGGRVATSYAVYERTADRWARRTPERGLLVEFYPIIVERDGALLGLSSFATNPRTRGPDGPTDVSPEARAYYDQLARAYAEAPRPRFVHLAGKAIEVMPELPTEPAELEIHDALTLADGTLYAVATTDESSLLLAWEPQQAQAQARALPRSLDPYPGEETPSLSRSGDFVLVGGAAEGQPYLIQVRGSSFERIAVDVPHYASNAAIRSAARSPDGDLWIVIGGVLWTKPSTGDWRAPSLPQPALVATLIATDDAGDPSPYDGSLDVLAVAWARDAAWVVATLGPHYDELPTASSAFYSIVYTTAPPTTPFGQRPTSLAPFAASP